MLMFVDVLCTPVPELVDYQQQQQRVLLAVPDASNSRTVTAHSYATQGSELSSSARQKKDDPFTSLSVQGRNSNFSIRVYGKHPLPDDYRTALETAFRLVADFWPSAVVVRAKVKFRDLGQSNKLAIGGGVTFMKMQNLLFPIGALEAITGQELHDNARNVSKYDIFVQLNSNTPWHVDVRTNPRPTAWDLATVVAHEAYHNLMFTGSIRVRKVNRKKTAYLEANTPSGFDRFLSNRRGCSILRYLGDKQLAESLRRSPGELLVGALTNDQLYFSSEQARIHVPLYAPRRYRKRSSTYHVDTRGSEIPSLMDPTLERGVRVLHFSADLLAMQDAYLNLTISGARACNYPMVNPFPANAARGKRGRIGTLPVWAFGLCMVLLMVVVVAIIFGACTTASLRQAAGKPPLWKQRRARADQARMWKLYLSGDTPPSTSEHRARDLDDILEMDIDYDSSEHSFTFATAEIMVPNDSKSQPEQVHELDVRGRKEQLAQSEESEESEESEQSEQSEQAQSFTFATAEIMMPNDGQSHLQRVHELDVREQPEKLEQPEQTETRSVLEQLEPPQQGLERERSLANTQNQENDAPDA